MADITFEDILKFAEQLTPEERARLIAELEAKRPAVPFWNERTVTSLMELFDLVFAKKSSFFKHDELYIFRGQADSSWGLVPAIFREFVLPRDSRISQRTPIYAGSGQVSLSKLRQICDIERVIYQEFFERLRAYPQAQVDKTNPWEMLCVAQHFGVPTRLLDWTDNLMIATYFSVSKLKNVDGTVWCLNATETAAMVNLAMFQNLYDRRAGISRINDLPHETSFFIPRNEHQSRPNDPAYGFRLIQPPDIEERIINQGGIFTVDVTTTDYSKEDHDAPTHYDHADLCKAQLLKIVIPATAKKDIKKDLERIGTNYRQIYPDLFGLGMYFSDMREVLIMD